jgi:hypothetical protein
VGVRRLQWVEQQSEALLELQWLRMTVSLCSSWSRARSMADSKRICLAGPDLASSLAAALAQRKGDMGDSDEEESDDEWD